MKSNKAIIITTLIAIITIMVCGTAMAEDTETFELLGVVTAWQDHKSCTEYTVTVEDGTLLAFYADKTEYRIGDMMYLIMQDEQIIDVYWITSLEWDEMYRWLMRINY